MGTWGRFTAPGVTNAAAKQRAQNPSRLDAKELMKLLWDLGDSVLDFDRGNRDRPAMVKLVVWARIAAHLRPQTNIAKSEDRVKFAMATKGDFTTLTNKLKKITGVESQPFPNDIKGFIVILVTDRSKLKSGISAKFPVLICRRKKEDGTNLITDDMALAPLQASIDAKNVIHQHERISPANGDKIYNSFNLLLTSRLGVYNDSQR